MSGTVDLGETEAPPLPPSGTFDARFASDLLTGVDLGAPAFPYDFRSGSASTSGTVEYQVSLQPGDATEVTLAWDVPSGVTGTLTDFQGGSVFGPINMSGVGSTTLTGLSAADVDVKVTLSLDGTQEPTEGVPGVFFVDGNAPDAGYWFRDTGVTIDFSNIAGSSVVTVERYDDPPEGGLPGGLANASAFRWVVERASGTLTFNDQTQFRVDASDPAALGIFDEADDGITDDMEAVAAFTRSTPGSGTYTQLATTYDPGDSFSGDEFLVATGFTDFSEFVLASDSEPLPVELTAFDVARDGTTALLTWATASETNNAGFAIQHKAPSAADFEEAGFVEGHGTTDTPQSYRFRVRNLTPGTHAFRLRQVDTDGTTALSDVVRLTVEAPNTLSLQLVGSNPVRTETTVAFTVPEQSPVQVDLYNALGQRVRTLFDGVGQPASQQLVALDAANLPSGMYFVRLQAPQGTRTQQIAVIR